MAFIDYLEKVLTENEFSLEILNDCRMHFQYGGFDENDKKLIKCLTKNLNKN